MDPLGFGWGRDTDSVWALASLRESALPFGLIVTAIGGLALLLAGAAGIGGQSAEAPLTIGGGLLLIIVHVANWRQVHDGGLYEARSA